MHAIVNFALFYLSVFANYTMIPDCCGGCHNIKHVNNYESQGKFANDSNLGKIEDDIVYPFLGKTDTLTISGWYFMPVIDISSITVVTNKKVAQEIILELIRSSLKLWPLLSICMMMTVIAGFFMWILVSLKFLFISWRHSVLKMHYFKNRVKHFILFQEASGFS